MRYRCTTLCTLALIASLPACFDTEPERFSNLAELTSYQKKEGYVMIANFGAAWPAEVVTERQYRDNKVDIILANSEAHTFDDHDGYKLRVITLKGKRNAEIVVVFRSTDKA
ncbi:MAG: hypothetical protein ACYTGN_17625 [Planctomycetota bacterium]|jgi:hypothetical protein